MKCQTVYFTLLLRALVQGWTVPSPLVPRPRSLLKKSFSLQASIEDDNDSATISAADDKLSLDKQKVTIVGAGWGGLAAAYALSKKDYDVTVVEASPNVGGLVRDGFSSQSQGRPAEAGQHGFWNNYHNIYRLLDELNVTENGLSDRAEQGQFSPRGLEAVWPVYKDQPLALPTGIAQLVYTRFFGLPLQDRLTAIPLVLAFSDFDDSAEAWARYDDMSFRDLCVKLGVSRRCYDEAFEPMILTGLFAPGAQCSAAAALGMAYFFVMQSQTAFDVQWCRGNIGDVIFQPWVEKMKQAGVKFECSTRFTGIQIENDIVKRLHCTRNDGSELLLETDKVIFAVGAKALNAFVRFSPELAAYKEFQRFGNLRGTSVLATRIFLDKNITMQFSANGKFDFPSALAKSNLTQLCQL
jgi:uncharacterized protein with NAD-binding domain and iron-sulfur cluster